MPKINAGSNATVSLTAGQVISVSAGGGLIRFEFPAGTVLFEGDGVDQTFGPYASSGNCVITSLIGAIDYSVSTPPGSVAPFVPSSVAITGGTIGDGVQFGEYYQVSSQRLRKWRAALARAKSGGAVARIACVGDSTVRGAWSNGAFAANVAIKAWPTKLAALFNANGSQAQSESFWGDGNLAPLGTADPRVSLGGGWASTGVKTLGNNFLLSTATGVLSFTPTTAMKSYDVYYGRNTGTGTFNLDIGGTGTTLINTNGSNALVKTTITNAGAASTSPLNITWQSGAAYIAAVEGKNTSDIVSVLNMGWSSSKVSDWVASTGTSWDPLTALPIVAPDLTIVSLCINDWVAGTDIATYKAGLQSLITSALQAGDCILLTGAPSNTANASAAQQAAFVAANYALAQSNGIPLLDISYRFNSYAISQPLGLYGDSSLHPSGAGYADIAACVFKSLSV